MSSSVPPRPSIQEFGLEDREQVSLYLELIRIIEKDIDEIKAGDTRSGWTSWAIIGGIVGALLLLFGETRKLQSFPTEEVKTFGLAGVLLYNIAVLSIKAFHIDQTAIRPGRIRWSNDAYFSFVPAGLYGILILLATIYVAFSLSLPILVKITTLVALSLWIVLMLFVLVLSRIKFAIGTNRISRKSGLVISLVSLLVSALALALLGMRLRFPLGEVETVPYILAGLILAIIMLIWSLISTMAPSRLLSNLQDLRNDIIFLRVEIDGALRRYETLSEGETLPDALQKELSEIVNDLNLIEYTHSNMSVLIQKMNKELPSPNDLLGTKEQKARELVLDKDSYFLHDAKCTEILNALQTKLRNL